MYLLIEEEGKQVRSTKKLILSKQNLEKSGFENKNKQI